jgi:peptidoglycan hydrolase-like protein with peptidoglycan-binding domain
LTLVVALLAFLTSWVAYRPAARLVAPPGQLMAVRLQGPAHVAAATARVGGATVPLVARADGTLWPTRPLPDGAKVLVVVRVSGPAWLAWVPGEALTLTRTVATPDAPHLKVRQEVVEAGSAVVLAFTRPGQVRGLGPHPLDVDGDHDTIAQSPQLAEGAYTVETRAATWEAWSKPMTLRWTSESAGSESVLALQRDLAVLGYLPLAWRWVGPGVGRFSWKYALPTSLTALWSPGFSNVITTGAVWQFERETGLPVGTPTGATFWADLRQSLETHRLNTEGYTYVQVSQGTPERLRLWFNGKLVIDSLANTAKPPGVTHVGTFPVFLRYVAQSMRGTDPGTGKPYYYPDVPWVSYFKGNDAVHGFVRRRYGFPQSAGCVELPVATAQRVFGYMHYGTLVTVLPIPVQSGSG